MRWRNPRRTVGLRVASGGLALGGVVWLVQAGPADILLPYAVAAVVAAGLALHRAELKRRSPRIAETAAFSVVLAALFGAAAAVLTGRAGRALSEFLYGLGPGLALGLIAGLLLYALAPEALAGRAPAGPQADRESADGG